MEDVMTYPATMRECVGPYSTFALPFNQTNLADASGVMESWEASNTLTPPMPFALSVRRVFQMAFSSAVT